ESNQPGAIGRSPSRLLVHAETVYLGSEPASTLSASGHQVAMKRNLATAFRTAQWDQLLTQAELCLPTYLAATEGLSHESKGIRKSELFFCYALIGPMRPDRLIESGRGRAQSTLVLSRLFPSALIVSLESAANSPDAAIAAERLRNSPNVECRFG